MPSWSWAVRIPIKIAFFVETVHFDEFSRCYFIVSRLRFAGLRNRLDINFNIPSNIYKKNRGSPESVSALKIGPIRLYHDGHKPGRPQKIQTTMATNHDHDGHSNENVKN